MSKREKWRSSLMSTTNFNFIVLFILFFLIAFSICLWVTPCEAKHSILARILFQIAVIIGVWGMLLYLVIMGTPVTPRYERVVSYRQDEQNYDVKTNSGKFLTIKSDNIHRYGNRTSKIANMKVKEFYYDEKKLWWISRVTIQLFGNKQSAHLKDPELIITYRDNWKKVN